MASGSSGASPESTGRCSVKNPRRRFAGERAVASGPTPARPCRRQCEFAAELSSLRAFRSPDISTTPAAVWHKLHSCRGFSYLAYAAKGSEVRVARDGPTAWRRCTLASAYDEHRAARVGNHDARYRAEQPALEEPAAAMPGHDEIGAPSCPGSARTPCGRARSR